MYSYPASRLRTLLAEYLQKEVKPDTWNWLQENKRHLTVAEINKIFVLIPRKTGKTNLVFSNEFSATVQHTLAGLSLSDYTVDRLSRLWLLLNLDETDEVTYCRTIEGLFLAADVSELVCLYGALPALAYAHKWTARCAEGIRSNIGTVLEAIMYSNPYPADNLSDAAWNQLILKAFFTDKDINRIHGVDKRRNKPLSDTLIDYAHERWAASRTVPAQLWRLVAPFINDSNFKDIQRAATAEETITQQAALLACSESNFPSATALLLQHPEIMYSIQSGLLNWQSVAQNELSVA